LQFEYRVGKLSDEDYQRTKLGLQKELAAVLAEVDQVLGKLPAAKPEPAPARDARQCPHCGAKFEREMKFCGECGKSMQAEQSA
jgi:NADH pyrophosphatase NudC (nudix superfamily)